MKLELLTPYRHKFDLYVRLILLTMAMPVPGFPLPQWAPRFDFTACPVAIKIMAIVSMIMRN